MTVLNRLLQEDIQEWETVCMEFQRRNIALKVPAENTSDTLHEFNVALNELYTEVYYWFARSRRNKDGIERLIDNVLKDYYAGKNELARKAAGIQYAQHYPAPDFYYAERVNLFELEDTLKGFHYSLESTLKTLQAKAEAKITSNSILNLERSLTPS